MIGYTRFGEGEHKVLALHGWFGDQSTFDSLQQALDPTRFTYAAVAYRGYGVSKDIEGQFTIEEIAQDSLALADALGWSEFSLLGHSMGGKAAQRMLVDAPDRITKIVAVTPVPASAIPFDALSWELFEGAVSDATKRAAIVNMSTGNRLSTTWIRRIVDHSFATSRPEAFAGYLESWAKTDFERAVVGATTPIKVFIGRHDLSITEEVAQAGFRSIFSNCEISVLENAGHYPMDETPIALATEVEKFLLSDGLLA